MSTESEVFQFLYAAATYIVTGQDLAELLRLAACFTGVGATGRKAAAGFGINGRDKLAFQDNALFLVVDIRGLENSSLVGLVSTSWPRYMTQMLCEI